MKIKWFPAASRSLDEVFEFLEAMSPVAAVKTYNNILDDIKRLESMPLMAPLEPWLDEEPERFRSLVACRRYKVIYYVEDDTVFVADIWDCRQNPETLRKRVAETVEK